MIYYTLYLSQLPESVTKLEFIQTKKGLGKKG